MISALIVGTLFYPCMIFPEHEESASTTSYDPLSFYFSDDGSPSNYVADMNLSNEYAVVKSFPSVTVPTNSDLIVAVWSRGASDAVNGMDMRVRVGNVDNGYNFSGSYRTNLIQTNTATTDAGWFKTRFYGVNSFLANGRVGVNITGSSLHDYAICGYDTQPESAGCEYWSFEGPGLPDWVDRTIARTVFIRLYFVDPHDISTDHTDRQIQLTSLIDVGSQYFSGEHHYYGSKWQLLDGLQAASTSTGRGWFTGNKTAQNYVNLTFYNRTIIAIGDSIMAGYPYHSNNPFIYGAADLYNHTPTYSLSLLLGQNVVNRGVANQTTGQMRNRFDADVMSYQPDCVIIEGGINDVWYTESSVGDIIANLTEMIDRVLTNHSKVILWTMAPANILTVAERVVWNNTNDWIRAQNSSDVIVVDMAKYLAGSQPWFLNDAYRCDSIHMRQQGNDLLANKTFEIGFGGVASAPQEYVINSLVFEMSLATTDYNGRPGNINLTWDGGFEIVTLANAGKYTFNMADITTDFLNISLISYYRMGNHTPIFNLLGEIRIYGYAPGGRPNITSVPTTEMFEGENYTFLVLCDQYIMPGDYGLVTDADFLTVDALGLVTGTAEVHYDSIRQFYVNFTATNFNGVGYLNVTLTVNRTAHAPIVINGNSQFAGAAGVTAGNGTLSNPYIIEKWEIDATSSHGIRIENTTAYFVIRGCSVHSNTSATFCIILNNCSNGLIEQTIMSDNQYGINILSSNNITLNDNNFQNCDYGVSLGSSNDNELNNNNFSNNQIGITLASSDNNIMTSNLLYSNLGYGISINLGSNNFVWNNTFVSNNGASDTFSSSHIQAYDYGTDNRWNNTVLGNYWGDWAIPDNNQNGIVDSPYLLAGGSGAKDDFPLVSPPGVDITPPMTTCLVIGALGLNGWYVLNVSIILTAIDNYSGVNRIYWQVGASNLQVMIGSSVTIYVGGYQNITFWSVDNASNAETAKSLVVRVDEKAPESSANESKGVVTISASDAESGINCTYYRINNGILQIYSAPLNFTEAGNYTMEYYSIDDAGNEEAHKILNFTVSPIIQNLDSGIYVLLIALIVLSAVFLVVISAVLYKNIRARLKEPPKSSE